MMKRMSFIWLLALLAQLPAHAAISDRAERAALPRPSVEMQPEDVVRTVVNALAANDSPYIDAGIETTFRFASPANRVSTGPLDRFTRMVKAAPYGIMVDHRGSEFSEVVYDGAAALQLVRLTAADGRRVVFAFRLSKQRDGEFKDMWMTDAVWPVASGDEPGQAF